MRKFQERDSAPTCWSKAHENEMLFILLARDAAAPAAIRAWIGERLRLGLNSPTDEQIVEAENAARIMEAEREAMRRKKGRE